MRSTMLAAATLLVAVTGCGSERPGSVAGPGTPTPAPSATSASAGKAIRGPQPVEVQYLTHITGSDGEGWYRVHAVTDGGTRVRLKTGLYDDPGNPPGEEYLYIWDGNQVLEYSQSNQVPYTVYEAPREHPDQLLIVLDWGKTMWSAAPDRGCTDLKGTKTIIGRVAVGYRCVEPTPEPGAPAEGEVWVDRATGILLEAGPMVAEKLVLNPKIDATTFSTRPPSGAQVIVIAAKNASPGQTRKAPDFTLDLVKGGRIGLKDLAGKPFVLAFFPSELAFGESSDTYPGYRDALLTLQTSTNNGTKPRVLGVQEGSLGKPGYPLVVPGLTLTLAHEENPIVNGSFAMASFVFVRSDGTIAASYDRAPTEQEITQSLAALQ